MAFSQHKASYRTELQRLAASGATLVELDAMLSRAGELSDNDYAELWAYAWALARAPRGEVVKGAE